MLHGDGPASTWAAQAKPGQQIVIGGPRGSMIIPDAYDWYFLAGDETALPAIGRRLEELPATARVVAVIEVEDKAEAIADKVEDKVESVVESGVIAETVESVKDAAENIVDTAKDQVSDAVDNLKDDEEKPA